MPSTGGAAGGGGYHSSGQGNSFQNSNSGYRGDTMTKGASGQTQSEDRGSSSFRNYSAGRENDNYFTSREPHPYDERVQFSNHSGGTESMQYQPKWNQRGGGVARGRGRGVGRGTPIDVRQRAPINDPSEETLTKLPKGKFWHDSSDPACCCKTSECGVRQEVPFCQGCGQHHHEREFCYKGNDSRYNATGYWCDNRKGQPPIQSLGGTYPGSPKRDPPPQYSSSGQINIPPPPPSNSVRFNMTDANSGRS